MKKAGVSIAMTLILASCVFSRTAGAADPAVEGTPGFDSYDEYHLLGRRYIADEKGTVIDTKTNLEWFVGPDADTTWDEARAWVEGLLVDGGGWRMPTREEVKSIYHKGAGNQNMSPLFKTTGGFVWTGEMMGDAYAWGFCFDIGGEYWPLRTFSTTARVFAVRPRRE